MNTPRPFDTDPFPVDPPFLCAFFRSSFSAFPRAKPSRRSLAIGITGQDPISGAYRAVRKGLPWAAWRTVVHRGCRKRPVAIPCCALSMQR